jgi:hypothetical protein
MSSYLQSLQSQGAEKVVYQYNVPEKVGRGEIQTVGLVELTAEDELEASRMSKSDTSKMAFELAKRSLVEVNGERLKPGVETERTWNRMPAKVRSLVLQGYVQIHTPQDEDTSDFLESRMAKIG